MKKGECSALLLVLELMQVANCVCFCLDPFCGEVNEGCLPHNKTDMIEAVHILSSHLLGLAEVERPERSTTFSFFRYIK